MCYLKDGFRNLAGQELGLPSFYVIIAKRVNRDSNYFVGRDVTKVGIVITDGKSVNINATSEESRAAREEKINMIAIGVGDNIFRFRHVTKENCCSNILTILYKYEMKLIW